MIEQTYQAVTKIILEELMTNPVDFKKVDVHTYFYNLKNKNPEKYVRLIFDINGHEPFSKSLSEIFMDCLVCGYVDLNKNIIPSSKERIEKFLSEK
jgi:hypothetical protein